MRPSTASLELFVDTEVKILSTSAFESNHAAAGAQSWTDRFAQLSAASREREPTVDDLEQLALCAYMLGKDDECADFWMRAHQAALREGDQRRAARCAFWQACGLLFRGEMAPAMGWIARGRRVLETAPPDCPEQGWLSVFTALPRLFSGDIDGACPGFIEAVQIAQAFDDHDLLTFARLGQGQTLVIQQRTDEGMALLDEIMVAVTSGELYPILTGIVYCTTIDMCHAVFDLRRAREWTEALSRWCDSQPDLVPFRGNCLILRCEIFRLQGSWHEAFDAAQQACDLLSGPPVWDTLGSAYYQLGEMQRLRGLLSAAEQTYRQASRAGRNPEPGMSLLRLAQGDAMEAVAGIRRALDETTDRNDRAKLLPAFVEISLEAHDLDAARPAVDELREIAARLDAPYLHALASHAHGALMLSAGNARAALDDFQQARTIWHQFNAPYELARLRILIGRAYAELDDNGGAELEFDAARSLLIELDATADIQRLDHHLQAMKPPESGDLSPREREVLVLLSTGKTNRAIAGALFISEKTVARHVSNIFTKLDLSSRAEATAYAFQHGIVR